MSFEVKTENLPPPIFKVLPMDTSEFSQGLWFQGKATPNVLAYK